MTRITILFITMNNEQPSSEKISIRTLLLAFYNKFIIKTKTKGEINIAIKEWMKQKCVHSQDGKHPRKSQMTINESRINTKQNKITK